MIKEEELRMEPDTREEWFIERPSEDYVAKWSIIGL